MPIASEAAADTDPLCLAKRTGEAARKFCANNGRETILRSDREPRYLQ